MGTPHTETALQEAVSKVPAVTLGFWIIKIAATTLGETGGDTVSMSLGLGYLAGTAIFASALVVLVFLQVRAKQFHPWLYWLTIIASTTAGTTLADFADRSLGIGYAGGSAMLVACVLGSLLAWRSVEGRISADDIATPRAEVFYWVTITFAQTLGTALGDWTADEAGLGYVGGAMVFAGMLTLVAAAYFWGGLSRTLAFWAAFILTRPLGATVGDFLDKPLADGGLALSRPIATLVLFAFIALCITLLPQKAGRHASS